MEAMPVWSPPTPPQDDNDIYIDHSLNLLYDTAHIMPESQLPPVYVKKESKRIRLDPALSPDGRRPLKFHRKEDIVTVFPRSLFDRPSPALVKLRRDFKLQKYRGIMRPPVPIPGIKPSAPVKATPEPEGVLEWLIYEDWALLQAIQNYQGLPLSLIELTPGHTRNWDLVADLVNNISRVYRSPKQCKNRYESIIVPREEGKLLYDVPKKQKKTKSIIKNPMQSKNNRMMRTSQLFAQDNNSSFTQLLKLRFDNMKAVSIRKSQATKSIFINPTMKNPKHTAVLAECGVTYDAPIVPEDIAQRRIERIAKEKQKLPSSAVVSSGQQSDLSRQQALSKMTGAVPAVNQISQQQNLSAASQSQALPIIPSASSSIAAVQSVSSSPLSVAISQSQIQTCGVQQITTVSTMSQAHAAPQTIAIVSAGITGGQSGGIATLTTASSLRAQRIVAPTNLQEVLQQRANSQSPTVVSVGNLSSTLTQQAQLQARIFASNQQQQAVGAAVSKVVTSNTVTTSRNLTAAQIQLYRQRMNQQARLGLVNAQTQQLVQTAGGTLVQGTAIIQGGLVSASPAIQTSLSGVTGVVQGQKVSVAVTNINTATVVTAAGVQTVQVAQPRTQFIKQVTGKQTIARHMTDSEMAILLSKNKHLLSQQKALAAGGAHTQIFAQAGLQVQQGTAGTAQVTTLVKAGVPVGSTSVTIPVSGLTQVQQKGGMKTAATATPQQIRQLQLQQLALQAQRKGGKVTQIAQVAGKGGLQTQLIVQTPKSLPGVTMQQIQQVIRHVPGGIQTGQVLLGKGGARVIPGTGQPGSRQTIQVVTATSAAQALNNLRNSVGNVQQATSIHGALKVQQSQSIATTSQQQALFSQVSAALSQPVSVSVRQSGGNQVRLQTPLMAVVQQPQQQQQLQQQLQQLQQQQLQQQLQQQQQQQQQQQAQNTSETHQTKK